VVGVVKVRRMKGGGWSSTGGGAVRRGRVVRWVGWRGSRKRVGR